MAKIISVWGSPGSGKSVFCAALAKHLTRNKDKAIIISGDNEIPMLPVWLPNCTIETKMSVGNILMALELNSALVASKVNILKNYPFIGLIGYASGDTPISYPNYTLEKVKQLITEASSLVDYVIIDCCSSSHNLFTPVSIELADVVIGIFTPNLKGIGYYKSHQPMLSDARFKLEQHLTFAGMARPFHPTDEMEHLVSGFSGVIPYHKEIEKSCMEGEMFAVSSIASKKFQDALEKASEVIQDE